MFNNDKFLRRIEVICYKDSDKDIWEKLAKQYIAFFHMELAALKRPRKPLRKKLQTYKEIFERVEQHP